MKKKYLVFLLALMIAFNQGIAQKGDMVLNFEGKDANTGNFVPLDSVFIENLTQGGDTTIYGEAPYLYLSWPTSIGEFSVDKRAVFALSPNYPNPFGYCTEFKLTLQNSENIILSLTDVYGNLISQYQNELCHGIHNFELFTGGSGIFILTASNGKTAKSLKLISKQIRDNDQRKIVYTGITNSLDLKGKTQKGDFVFQAGDQLAMTAMAAGYQQKTIYDNPYENTSYSFELQAESTIPIVSTLAITDITQRSAIGGGNVSNDGGMPVTARGLCWSTTQNPTIADNYTVDGTGTGIFSSNITGLLADTAYYVKAYATNAMGTGYGNELTFNTLPIACFNTTYVDYRQVLLEEFTGHTCVNCPEAAILAHDLALELDHKLIVYSIHAGIFAEPIPGTPFDADYRTTMGDALYNDFTIFANPLALIDRVEFNGLRQIFVNNWETVVLNELQLPNIVNMRLSNTYFQDTNTVLIKIESEFLQALNDQFKLAVYIVEDSLISPQLNNDPSIGGDTLFNYVHRNVLRDNISPIYGDFLGDEGNITVGEVYVNEYTYHINNVWLAHHCRIIAFVGRWDVTYNFIDIVQSVELEINTNIN